MTPIEVPTENAALITPTNKPIVGSTVLPGSKSVTNRALLLGSLANGESKISGMLVSDDTRYMRQALCDMGVTIELVDETSAVIGGTGKLNAPKKALFLGNAGTAMRFLTAAAALADGETVLDGDEYMRKRPIQPLVEALQSMGVGAESTRGCAPVTIRGTGGLTSSRSEIDGGLSSQYISAILMVAACGNESVDIVVGGGDIGGRGYIDITLSVMAQFGNTPEALSPNSWRIRPTGYEARNFSIEPDASAATYLWGAEAITGGRIDLGVTASEMAQPDARSYRLISMFPHMPPLIDGSQIQDSVPTLAVLAAFNKTPVRFSRIENLRVKECDRIEALCIGLNSLTAGMASIEGDDLIVQGNADVSKKAEPAIIETFEDHRIAMSFALAGLRRENVYISHSDCVSKTFPNFWNCLQKLGVKIDIL